MTTLQVRRLGNLSIRLSFQELAEIHHWDLNPEMASRLVELLGKLLEPRTPGDGGPWVIGGEINLG
jgi:hypothetical protein